MITSAQNTEKNIQIGSFLDAFAFKLPVIKEAEKKIDRYLSRKYNVFNYINPDEMGLSRIIGDLLKVDGSHGQGDVFLRLFVETFLRDVRFYMGEHSKVFLEYTTYLIGRNRRIDILVQGKSGALIGIENKPWADEQDDQLEDYARDLSRRSKNNYTLIYLMGSYSKKPLELPENTVIATYRNLRSSEEDIPALESWLSQCIDICKSHRFKQFLEDFLSYIQFTFEEEDLDNANP